MNNPLINPFDSQLIKPAHSLPMNVMPGVVESTPRGERFWDMYSLLLKERIIMLFTPIDANVATTIIAQLLYLEREDQDKDIIMYIQSPGGHITAGLAIYDTMQLIRPEVSTICVGMAASMATVLLCSGAKGKRYALPNSTVHMHQPLGGAEGQASDILIAAKEISRNKDTLNSILVKHTGQPLDRIIRDTDRDYYLDPEGAKEYGIVDEILVKPPKEAPKKK